MYSDDTINKSKDQRSKSFYYWAQLEWNRETFADKFAFFWRKRYHVLSLLTTLHMRADKSSPELL